VRPHHGSADRDPIRPSADPPNWEPPVLTTVASKGEGIRDLVTALDQHHEFLERSGKLRERRKRRLAARTRAVVNRAIRQWVWDETRAEELVARRLEDVVAGTRSPYEVAAEVLDQVRNGK
jgi:GTPase